MTKEYYLMLKGEKVVVTEEVFKGYWQVTNRENYMKRVDRKNHLFFFSSFPSDMSIENVIADQKVDIEKLVETKFLMEMVQEALMNLTEEERELINLLFFEESSLREVARQKKISHQAVLKRKNKILEKLRSLFVDE